MGRSHDFLEPGKSAEALKVQFGQSELPIELLCSQEQSELPGIAISGNLCPMDMGQFLATWMLGHDPPWSFVCNLFWTGWSWLVQNIPAERLTLIHYSLYNTELQSNSVERLSSPMSSPEGCLVQCPNQSTANFIVLGKMVTINFNCLKQQLFNILHFIF